MHLFPVDRDESYPIDNLLLTRPNDLYVRRQLHPRRYGNIIEGLKSRLISQKFPGSTQDTGDLRAFDIDVVVPDPKLIEGPTGNDTLAAGSKAEEEVHGIGIAI